MDTPNVIAIALDLGTTAIKAGLVGQGGAIENMVVQPAPPISVVAGHFESDARCYAETTDRVLGECLAQTSGSPPLGLCSQRSSFLIWERSTGHPLTPLISWQDNRGLASCEDLKNSESLIQELTGLRLTPYYFAPKLRVVLQERPEWRAQLERGELLVGTLDSYLIWRWTGGEHHVTDASMAARTQLLDIRRRQWSPVLCKLFGIPQSILPHILPSVDMHLQLNNGLTLHGSLGDQSAALVACLGRNGSEVLVNLGTGGFVMRYLPEGDEVPNGYLHTLVYQDSRTHFAIEGTLNSLAAALAPYPVSECRVEDLATNDIFCLAEPSGLGAPYFRSDLGIIFSASVANLNPNQIGCLLLEGIIFRVTRILEDFQRVSPIERVYLSGGLSELECLQQGIASCTSCDTYRLRNKDVSLLGAALLATDIEVGTQSTEKIAGNAPSLLGKYRRWKDWLDDFLQRNGKV